MRLIDATDLVRRVLDERDKIPLEIVERYSFGVPTPNRHGQAMRGGIRKALRCIETSPTVDAVEVVRCRDCIYWKPPHIRFDDGTERPYLPGEGYVSISVGINVCGQCLVDCGVGYPCDKTVFRSGNMFCSKGVKMDAEVEGCR